MISTDEYWMLRCIELAKKGLGNVAPNPMVGCVIVRDNKVVSESFHKKFGEGHAEANAIAQVEDKSILKDCTLYVSLEPCAHYGKTPPCANAIIEHNFKRVVIGSYDPFHKVNGKGIDIIRSAGIEVTTGICEDECNDLNKRFFSSIREKRPYIILKWAQTKSGFIGVENFPNFKISNGLSQQINQLWRGQEQAILIGNNTANIDNPSLTCRNINGKNPLRFVIDLNNKLNNNLKLLNDGFQTFVFSNSEKKRVNNTEYLLIENNKNPFPEIFQHLNNLSIQSIIIEGGSKTLQSFIDSNLWHEARIITSDINLKNGVLAPTLSGGLLIESFKNIDQHSSDEISIFRNLHK